MQTYAKTDDAGAVIEYPLNELRIKNRGHRLDMYEPVTPTRQPRHDRLTETVAERKPARRDDGHLAQTWEVSTKPLDMLRKDMTAHLAAIRYDRETSSITLPDGSRIHTDRGSQAQLASAYQSLTQPFVASIDWKGPDGWVNVTEVELRPIAEAVAQHVQGCFTAERRVSEQQIDAATSVDDLVAIDIEAAFAAELEAVKAG